MVKLKARQAYSDTEENYKTELPYSLLMVGIHGKLGVEGAPLFQLDPVVFDKMAFVEIFREAQELYSEKLPITTAGLIHRLGTRLKWRPLLEPIIGILIDMEAEKHDGEYLAGHLKYLLSQFQEARNGTEPVEDVKPAEERKEKPLSEVNQSGFSEVELEFYEERAAILEFDGGMCRENAETEAAKLTLIFFGKAK